MKYVCWFVDCLHLIKQGSNTIELGKSPRCRGLEIVEHVESKDADFTGDVRTWRISRGVLWGPLTHQRIHTPVRGEKCAHLQCFDLKASHRALHALSTVCQSVLISFNHLNPCVRVHQKRPTGYHWLAPANDIDPDKNCGWSFALWFSDKG